MRPAPLALSLAFLAAAGLTACASAPRSAPGEKRRTVLVTRADEEAVGRDAAADVAARIGVLEDPELNAYVDRIGQKLLRGLPIRSFQYRFQVVDQLEPNAFALPGGYVFLSRGLLLLANSEDELACVIGHEITHVARHHQARQQALQRDTGFSFPWIRAGQMARYSRDMEREADQGGQILCGAAGYDPGAMATFLSSLIQAERLRRGYSRRPGFFDTHPGTQERAAINRVRASEIRTRPDPTLGDTREALLRRLDGLATSQRPEAGVFVGDWFLHPDLDFQIRFPSGWEQHNAAAAVGASDPGGAGVVYLAGGPPTATGKEAADAWLAHEQQAGSLEVSEAKSVQLGRMEAWRVHAEARSRGGSLATIVTFVPYGPATYRITGVSPAAAAQKVMGRTLATMRSFAPLDPARRDAIEVSRLRVVTARGGEDLAALVRRTDSSWDPTTTAVANGLFTSHRFAGGEQVKIARTEAYRPDAPGR